jgi:ribonuclease III
MNLQERLDQIESCVGYHFQNRLFLLEAIIHKSFAFRYQIPFHYERLEFLGDALLETYVTELLYEENAGDQGELTKIRAGLVSREMLLQITRELGLEPFVLVQESLRNSKGELQGGFLGDYFESILAAIFLDGGTFHARSFLRRIMRKFGHLKLEADYKSRLQEISLKTTKQLPDYDTIQGEDGYLATVCFAGNHSASGQGPSKKKAEQMAAKSAVEAFSVGLGRKGR